MANKKLVLITSDFPFGKGETFLETEVPFLAQMFETILIVSSNDTSTEQRTLPSNCIAIRCNAVPTRFLKIKSFRHLFSSNFWKEIGIIQHIYKQHLSFPILKTMLISLERASVFAKCLQQQKLDLSTTVFYSYWCEDTALGLALLNKKRGIKAISRMHRWDIYFEESSIRYLPFRHIIYNNLKKIISISNDGIDYAIQKWQVDAKKITLSRLGILPQNKIITKSHSNFTIFSCSNVIPVKRVHLIAEALQHIQHIPIRWVHFGDGSEFVHLQKQVQTLPPNIEVSLRGRVANSEIYRAFATEQPHLFINVSSSEGVPVSIMEAMSFGVPVLATNVGGNSEIVNTQNGNLLHSNPSATTIADEIKRFCSMTQESYNQYAENAYQTWKSEYNAEKNYTAFGEVLRGM